MIVLSNCLTETVDEGCLKLANSLIKRIKQKNTDTTVVAYQRKGNIADAYFKLNKFFLNFSFLKYLRNKKDEILFIPFPTRSLPMAIRAFVLSVFTKKAIRIVLTMKQEFGTLSKKLLFSKKVSFIVFSRDVADYYRNVFANKKIEYLKCGVDTKKFVPATDNEREKLREKYNIPLDKNVILHVGHLNYGRNVDKLLNISDEYFVLLVTSTLTKSEQDLELKQKLLSRENIKLVDDYIKNIEEIYQLSDIYFFPVVKDGHCIDIPLSCMEAAACNLPVITTDFGEMKEFIGKDDFYFTNDFDSKKINSIINDILLQKEFGSRNAVLCYDWNKAVAEISAS